MVVKFAYYYNWKMYFYIITMIQNQPLSCPPSMKLVTTTRGGKYQRYLLRGDSEGYVTLWTVPDITIDDIKQMRIDDGVPPKGIHDNKICVVYCSICFISSL